MTWGNLGLLGIVLLVGIGTLLLRWHWRRLFTVTRYTVRCPLHECPATIIAYTKPGARRGWRYGDVLACSLLPQGAIACAGRTATPPETPHDRSYMWDIGWDMGWYSSSLPQVPCRKDCLSTLETAVSPS
jgi:hypothetical protein